MSTLTSHHAIVHKAHRDTCRRKTLHEPGHRQTSWRGALVHNETIPAN
uniref:Uncharacterized protein n=1 Tax=Anguilla anguilla TaxID=7936 RepID=A0A0E9UAN5_ANGAN